MNTSDKFNTVARRDALKLLVGLAAMTGSTSTAAQPLDQSPGKPGEFDFLTGEWRIHNRMLDKGQWIEFPGEATVRGILQGIASIEELRIPARNFSGMGLRLLDVEKKVWSDFWVNAKSGVLTSPGQTGTFVNGVGTFTTEEDDNGTRVIYRGVWDQITPRSCRWFQGSSRDGGKTWVDTWFMDWKRA